MSKKKKNTKPAVQKQPAAPVEAPVEAPEEEGYIDDNGEPLMTEAEFRAKLEQEKSAPDLSAEDLSKMSKEEILDSVTGEGEDRYLEFTISGCYYDSKKETIDFEDVVGKIPMCDEEQGLGSMHVRRRFAQKWIKAALDKNGDPKYPVRIEKLRQVFIDDIKETTGTLSFVGKDIKALSIDEMQELAVAKDLRFVPLPGAGLSKRDMLIRTYVAYSEKVLLKKIKFQEEEFNFAKLPQIILDSTGRTDKEGKITNEEMIAREQENTTTDLNSKDNPKDRFSLVELKSLADSKNISYPSNIGFDDLYSYLFSA